MLLKGLIRFAALVAAIGTAPGLLAQAAEDFTVVYRPATSESGSLDPADSLAVLREFLGQRAHGWTAVQGYGVSSLGGATDFNVTPEGFRFSSSRYTGPTAFGFAELRDIEVVERSTFFGTQQFVRLTGEHFLMSARYSGRDSVHRRLADLLYVLHRAAVGDPAEEERFRAALAEYLSANPKPAFPEEARRYRVQAEFAVEQRRFADAARSYGEALKVAPWWPEGRFNLALVLAEVKRYPQAIVQMKRFLALEPQHSQARAAQDQIYRWESVAAPPAAAEKASPPKEEACRSAFGCASQDLRR